jgi:hypothetical protein
MVKEVPAHPRSAVTKVMTTVPLIIGLSTKKTNIALVTGLFS